MLNVYEQQDLNKRRSFIIMVGFVVFIALTTWIFSQILNFGLSTVALALIFSGLMSFFSYYWSDKIILAISQARPASKKKDFLFYTVTENLCLASQLPMPKLYVIDDTAMNAFATGRDYQHAVVCVTTGLLNRLNRTELEGVIGHELSHIKNYDMRLMSIVTILVGMITLLTDWFWRFGGYYRKRNREERGKEGEVRVILYIIAIFLALISPLIANLIKLMISRRREFLADAGSVMITRQPSGLISALKKLSLDKEPLEAANKATAHLYIVNPLKNLHQGIGWFSSLFNTHPPIKERIKALQKME